MELGKKEIQLGLFLLTAVAVLVGVILLEAHYTVDPTTQSLIKIGLQPGDGNTGASAYPGQFLDWRTYPGTIIIRDGEFNPVRTIKVDLRGEIEYAMIRGDKIYALSHVKRQDMEQENYGKGGIYIFNLDGHLINKSDTLPTHHFFDVKEDGTVLTLLRTFNLDSARYKEEIVELSPDLRQIQWRFDIYEKIFRDRVTGGRNWCHVNHVSYLPKNELGLTDKRFRQGNILLNCYFFAGVQVIDRNTGRLAWELNRDDLKRLHWPSFLPNGNLLVFDNLSPDQACRVVEVNPVSLATAWEYRPPEKFVSTRHGSVQRLPNGNTLISWGSTGRIQEVTRDHQLVVDVVHPLVKGKNNPEDNINLRGIVKLTEPLPSGEALAH